MAQLDSNFATSAVIACTIMITPEQTEKEFDLFFESIGFSRVSDDVGNSPSFQNADFVNKDKKIVVELKVLFKEHFDEGGLIYSLNAFIYIPKVIDESGLGQYSLTLSKKNREGKRDSFSEPIRRTLKKANKQLRETKQFYFECTPATGYVFLAQTGLMSLSPGITGALVRKQLDDGFSQIDGAIICTPPLSNKKSVHIRN